MRKDLHNIGILILLSLAIGSYLIATTVVISKDGVTYIERSQAVSSDFNTLIKKTPPIGYSLLIAGFHRAYSTLSNSVAPASWIVSSQICTLTCKTLAMVAIYFFGRCFFPRKHVYASLLIVTFLPYPTRFGVDVLRDWPHLLFLFSAMLFLIKGIQQSKWLYMALAGLICGLGQIIRPECAQVILYGLAIFLYQLYRHVFKKSPLPRNHLYFCLLAGFLLIFIPYTQKRGTIIPGKLKSFFSVNHDDFQDEMVHVMAARHDGLIDGGLKLGQTISENFHYYFVFPAGIGVYLRFFRRRNSFDERKLLMGLLMGFYCGILLLLHSQWGYISKRHTLPLCVALSFYIPAGIIAIASAITSTMIANRQPLMNRGRVLMLAGIVICLPKLLQPVGQDKKIFREAGDWIQTYTAPGDRFITFDRRIPFYGNRKHWRDANEKIRRDSTADYWIGITKNGRPEIEPPAHFVLAQTFEAPQKEKGIQIFRRTESRSY